MHSSTPVGRNPGEPAKSAVVAYLLLTHKDPHQVMALADRIHALSPTSHIVVHHDAKADTLPWDGVPPQWAHLVERVPVEWGDWSIVEATLRMFRFAHEELERCVVRGDLRGALAGGQSRVMGTRRGRKRRRRPSARSGAAPPAALRPVRPRPEPFPCALRAPMVPHQAATIRPSPQGPGRFLEDQLVDASSGQARVFPPERCLVRGCSAPQRSGARVGPLQGIRMARLQRTRRRCPPPC